VHTPVELDETDRMPSPLVPTLAENPPNSVAPAGKFVTPGAVGVARPTAKPCGLPSVAPQFAVPDTWAVREHEPAPTYVTVKVPATLHTPVELEVTDFTPSPVVLTAAKKLSP